MLDKPPRYVDVPVGVVNRPLELPRFAILPAALMSATGLVPPVSTAPRSPEAAPSEELAPDGNSDDVPPVAESEFISPHTAASTGLVLPLERTPTGLVDPADGAPKNPC